MSERMRRVNESVRQVLAEALLELKDPRIGLVTVTGVDTASDLRHATVYVSVLGSLLAATLTLRSLGKDAVMYLAAGAPLPHEYGFMPLSDVRREPPADAAERVLLAVDCAKEERIGDAEAASRAPLVVNVDHH